MRIWKEFKEINEEEKHKKIGEDIKKQMNL